MERGQQKRWSPVLLSFAVADPLDIDSSASSSFGIGKAGEQFAEKEEEREASSREVLEVDDDDDAAIRSSLSGGDG